MRHCGSGKSPVPVKTGDQLGQLAQTQLVGGTPARRHIQGGDNLGQHTRIAICDAGDEHRQCDSLGLGGQEPQQCVALEKRLIAGENPFNFEEVIGDGEDGGATWFRPRVRSQLGSVRGPGVCPAE